MSAIPSTIGRSRLQQTASGLRTVIPAQRSWYVSGAVYYLGTLLDVMALRYGAFLASLLFLGVAILALAGYRYRFMRGGVEISALGFRVKFIPVERITHYEESSRAFADGYSFGIYGRRRAFVWAGSSHPHSGWRILPRSHDA